MGAVHPGRGALRLIVISASGTHREQSVNALLSKASKPFWARYFNLVQVQPNQQTGRVGAVYDCEAAVA
jgi:hypothetical protein